MTVLLFLLAVPLTICIAAPTKPPPRQLDRTTFKELLDKHTAPSLSSPFNDVPHRRSQHRNWQSSGMFQGDIMLSDNDPTKRLFHNAVSNAQLKWSHGVIAYVIGNEFASWERDLLVSSMTRYHRSTCVRFMPRTDQRDYLHFVKSYGCYSQVGRTGGRQEISLGSGCLYHEIIVHELMHALGFWHEHSRADRDSHISIQWHNIMPGMNGQFDIVRTSDQDLLDSEYDYESVMHYDSRAFSANGQPTMIAAVSTFTDIIGTAMDLSTGDVQKVNTLYSCAQPQTTTTTTTQPPIIAPIPHDRRKQLGHCRDQFFDCPFFASYCQQASFVTVMYSYCAFTCQLC